MLKNNVKMPILGLGTSHYGGFSGAAVQHAVRSCGCRHIDTAKRYGVEAAIADAVQAGTHLQIKWVLDYMYLLHWPLVPSWCTDSKQLLSETWRTLELLYDEERVRCIGVSNFDESDLLELLSDPELSTTPHINQCEFHPFHNPIRIRDFCSQHHIQFEGYCPLGKGKILDDPVLVEMAKVYRKSVSQILIRWNIQQRVVCIPKSTKPERVEINSQVGMKVV
ncbi:hypothetical protein HAZT_HAZT010296 [Hyalella azteca]|uniref:NADP-dependent oxidoreductase domain-containing protein n=1 Tax=Hyalella azteca TaxID=294128 RepID=A0A6A0HFW8_HYAAZ|nr:hypothetical protein HAZT_HAZT010296 [Hyalella azteca]